MDGHQPINIYAFIENLDVAITFFIETKNRFNQEKQEIMTNYPCEWERFKPLWEQGDEEFDIAFVNLLETLIILQNRAAIAA